MENVSSLAEHKYKKNSVHFNLALDNENFAKMAIRKKQIRKDMIRGYMELLTNYHSK